MIKVKKLTCILISMMMLLLLAGSSASASLLNSIKRLDTLTHNKSSDAIDQKLMKALKIIDGMDENKKWMEVFNLINKKEFRYSRYFDELLYLYTAKLANGEHTGEMTRLWEKMTNIQNSEHLFSIMLMRIYQLNKSNKNSNKNSYLKNELKRVNDYIETAPDNTKIHAPIIEGNMLFGYNIKLDYSHGELPTLHTIKKYKESGRPLLGFTEENQYIGILTDTLLNFGFDKRNFDKDKLIVRAVLYEKGLMKKEAADDYYRLSFLMKNENNLLLAKQYIDLAKKNDPANDKIDSLKKEIELSLVLSGEEEIEAQKKTVQVATSKKCDDSYLFSHSKKLHKNQLRGKTKQELRLMRNEIFAKYGRPFRSQDLHEYFTKKCWYKMNSEYSDALLSQNDRHNILSIQEAEPGK